MSLIIDSGKLNSRNPADILLYVKGEFVSKYNTVNLCTITLKHYDMISSNSIKQTSREYVCYVHCSILNKDDNILNDEKSDVIGIVAVNNLKRYFYHKFPNISKRISSNDITAIRMTLRNEDDSILDNIEYAAYELILSFK